MRSPCGFYGALALLSVLPVAIVSGALFRDEESGLHFALAAGAWLLAVAMFDFRVDPVINRLASVTTAVLGGIFFLQAVAPLTASAAAYALAYDTLGQTLEGGLTLLFVAWCVAMLFSDTQGTSRLFGLATVLPLFAYAATAFVLKQAGSDLPDALKLLFLPVMVWLLVESREPANVATASTAPLARA